MMQDFLEKWKKYFVFVGLLSCFINILQLTFAIYMFAIYRSIVASYSEISLYSITVVALYALLSLGFFNYLRIRLLNVASNELNQRFGERLYQHIIKIYAGPGKKTYFQGLNDLNMLQNFFNNQGVYALFDVPWAPLYLLLIYFFHPVLGGLATTGAVIVLLLSLLQNRFTRERMAKANAVNQRNKQIVDTILRNAEVVNSMGMRESLFNRWDGKNADVIQNQTVASRNAGIFQSITKPFQLFMQVLMYGVGAYYVLLGQLDVGLMVAASIIMGQAIGPIMRVMGAWKFTLQAKSAYNRLSQFMMQVDMAPEKMQMPAPAGKISAEKVYFRIDDRLLLADISFALAPGEILGIIGPSGAGKTTLCRVLLGIWPAVGGKVRLDNVDLFYWDQTELGQYIGYLPQEVELFEASVAENIARMGAAEEAWVEEAAEQVNIDEWIGTLDKGYSSQLYGDEGIIPSGGQKQRIALARALYGQPKLMVLDEPNSNLDEAGEKDLTDLFARIKQKRNMTCVIVTHQPDILSMADKILVLKSGRQIQFGPQGQVMRQLFNLQNQSRTG